MIDSAHSIIFIQTGYDQAVSTARTPPVPTEADLDFWGGHSIDRFLCLDAFQSDVSKSLLCNKIGNESVFTPDVSVYSTVMVALNIYIGLHYL